jgi:hypothetical protein
MMKPLGLLFVACSFAFSQEATTPIQFSPEPLLLGKIEQGAVTHVVLKGKNQTTRSIQLETVMSQNVGSSNFKFPKSIAPGKEIKIEFDLNTAGFEGPFAHRIVLVEEGGHPLVTMIEGEVDAPILFSRQMLDAGYLSPDSKPEWTIYAWNPTGKKFSLGLDSLSSRQFTLQVTPVTLNTKKFDEIQEGGSTPGLKIVLQATNLGKGPTNPKMKSFRQIVTMKSTTWPKATPELLVVGYWK